jgi:hypothetical protein
VTVSSSATHKISDLIINQEIFNCQMTDYVLFCSKLSAFFQNGKPIYSSSMVSFRMSHCNFPRESESFVSDGDENQAANANENYVWTYTSPEFPMLQESDDIDIFLSTSRLKITWDTIIFARERCLYVSRV